MRPDVVVDVGNTRIKWGRCPGAAVTEVAALPPEDFAAWEAQLRLWAGSHPLTWLVSGVHPQRRNRLADWLRQHGQTVRLVELARELPLQVKLEHPDRVGVDRLFDAVAANSRRRPDHAAAIVDAGSAITVDYVDDEGAFRGGAILPGLRLMSQALHSYTALLPLVEVRAYSNPLGTSTPDAIRAGVFWAAAGGVRELLQAFRADAAGRLDVFWTGGDAPTLATAFPSEGAVWPEMTLEGIRLSAEALP